MPATLSQEIILAYLRWRACFQVPIAVLVIPAPYFNFTHRTIVNFFTDVSGRPIGVPLSDFKYSKKNCTCEVDVSMLRIRFYRRRSEDCDNTLKHVQGFILWVTYNFIQFMCMCVAYMC